MKKKMSENHKLMAYVLSTDADINQTKNITQTDIANLFGVSQSTVAQAIKEAKLRVRINELEQQLSPVKEELLQLDRIETLELPEIKDTVYKRKL